MSQVKIEKYLKKNKGIWFSNKELSKQLGTGVTNININLKKMLRRNEVERKEIKINHNGRQPFYWRYKK